MYVRRRFALEHLGIIQKKIARFQLLMTIYHLGFKIQKKIARVLLVLGLLRAPQALFKIQKKIASYLKANGKHKTPESKFKRK